jgi:probable rRNA maturation factor
MRVAIYNAQKHCSIDRKRVVRLVEGVLQAEKHQCGEVAIHFVCSQRISWLHAKYFGDPAVTDCISFPIDGTEAGPYSVLGEVFVCPETASHYIAEHGGDLYEEIALYVVHGLLHLLGYDDIEESDQAAMRLQEQFHMKNLKSQALLLQ